MNYESLFYIQRTIQEGWSRAALLNAIEADLYHKTGGAITNFEQHLELAQSKEYDENDLEDALEKNITQFLLELGTGFAFVGRQKEIVVAGKTRKLIYSFII